MVVILFVCVVNGEFIFLSWIPFSDLTMVSWISVEREKGTETGNWLSDLNTVFTGIRTWAQIPSVREMLGVMTYPVTPELRRQSQ